MPYSHSAGSTKRKQRQQLIVPCDCSLCQGKPQTYRVVRRHKQAFGKNLALIVMNMWKKRKVVPLMSW